MIKSHNDDVLYEHSLDHHLEFFSKAGSLFSAGKKGGRTAYAPYGGISATTTALTLFQQMWIINNAQARLDAMKLLFWMRNPRGGAGNRSGFRECLRWLASEDAIDGVDWLRANLDRVRDYGRFDDLKVLFGTVIEKDAAELWKAYIEAGDHYALKWAKRDMIPLQRAFNTNEAGLRKILRAKGRTSVEQHMCANLSKCASCGKVTHWSRMKNEAGERLDDVYVCENCGTHRTGTVIWPTIDYSHVPSKCMSVSAKTFMLHDPSGFSAYKAALNSGDAKVNASVLFPHDCLRTALQGQHDIANGQFEALPNYMEETGERIMAIADTSGSMGCTASGSVSCMDVSVSLGMYCSDRLGKDNPFYRRYMEFSSEPYFIDWRKRTFSQQASIRTGEIASTNIERTLDYLLECATTMSVAPDQMITTLLILSDMQFDRATSERFYDVGCKGTEATVVEKCMSRWEAAGYKRPRIVYWNLEGYAGQPAKVTTPNTALVSGFSPSILKAVLSGEDFTPLAIMRRTIDAYNVSTPAGAE